MKKEQIRNIDKDGLEEILKENNISLSDKAFNNCKRDKEDVFHTIWSAYNYGFEITPQKSKATLLSLYTKAVVFLINNVEHDRSVFPDMYETDKVTPSERREIVHAYLNNPRSYYIPRTLDEIYHQGFYSVEGLTKKLDRIFADEDFNIDEYININHVEDVHRLSEKEEEIGYKILRLIQMQDQKHETFFDKDFDYKPVIEKLLKENTDKIARFLLGHEERLVLTHKMDNEIGTAVSLNAEMYRTKDIMVVLGKDGFVRERTPLNSEYKRKACGKYRDKLENEAGTIAVSAFPYQTKDSVSMETRIPYKAFSDKAKESLHTDADKNQFSYMKSPLYRTYATIRDKYYNDSSFRFFYRKNAASKNNDMNFTVKFDVGKNNFTVIFNKKGEANYQVNNKDIDIETLANMAPVQSAFIGKFQEVLDMNNKIGVREWSEKLSKEDKFMLDGFGILDDISKINDER